ncbi:MAG: DUF5666 domain-containing protein [Gammaproteobacteria bacterium]|nr:DUF5666 domain-containing protein [Gammaproteobacteria bacterium]MDH5653259.1 DUF5666 domain-containing protein [Gammaproteobacteria bacterium]
MQWFKIILVAVLLPHLFLSGCDGGSSGDTNYAMGTVTKLGSVYVNGVRYHTNSATVTLDDSIVTDSQVLGMPVVVSSSSSNQASTVTAKTVVKGKITSINADGTSMVVLGQTIRLDDGATVSGITPAVDVLVEVTGLVKPGGVIVASTVEGKSALTGYKVMGYITSVDTGAKTFVIGGLTVNYGSATLSDMGSGPAVDMLVEVKAASDSTPLAASTVEQYGPGVSSASHIEVEGYVKGFSGSNPNFSFTVSGVDVTTNSSTTFEFGATAYLADNIKVEVEGSMSNGTLTASKVSLRDSIRVEGDMTGKNGNSFNIDGMAGISFTVDSNTEYNSTTDAYTDFSDNDQLRLRGVPTGATSVLVTRMDDRNPDSTVYLRGPISNETGNNVTVLGITVDVTTLTSRHNLDDSTMTNSEFLAAVGVGSPVKVSGTITGGTITWNQIELED